MTISPEQIAETRNRITADDGFFALEDISVGGKVHKAYKHAPKTVIEILQNGRNHGDLEFIVYEGCRYSYAQFYERVDKLAAALVKQYGIVAGDRVAIAMRNKPEWLLAYTAATLIGAIVVPINSWGKSQELEYAITDSGSKVLVCDLARWALVADRADTLGAKIIVDREGKDDALASADCFERLLAESDGDYEVYQASFDELCVILYTSGSTGFPKGVAHRHIAVCQSAMNMMFLGMLLMELEGSREFKGGAERETPLLTVPLFHATGLMSGYILPLMVAQKIVMLYKWDSIKALQVIEDEKVTSLSTVPAIVMDLLTHPEFDKYNTSSLIRVAGAGAATPAGMPELIEAKVGKVSRSAGYGMTETMAVCSTMSGAIYDLKPGSAGILSPIADIRFVGSDGAELAAGAPGEIEIRGVTCTPGYWEKPEANEKTFVEGGWMKTGDIGRLDEDGFLHITGRIKEIVIRGGENIYPGEIENIAYENDAVHEVVVFGEADEAMGEELVMVVYQKPGESITEDALRANLSEHLASYKVPKTLVFSVQPLPRNASEKLHRLKVKEQYLNAS